MYIHRRRRAKVSFYIFFIFLFHIHHAPSHVVDKKEKKRILCIFTVKGNEMKMHCTQYITSVNYVMLHYIEDGKVVKKKA